MKSSRWLWPAVLWAAGACNLYNEGLLEQASGDDGPNGGNASDGGTGGGTTSGGGTPGDGGTGGDETGGSPGDGGMGLGGEGTGGSDPGTGGGSGGDDGTGGGSGGGSGGSAGPPIGTIDDLEHVGTASYTSLPFYGAWDRYIEMGGMWTATAGVGAMVQARFDDAADHALHVQATALDDWGVGVFLTLKSGGALNLTGVTGIRFDVATMNGETTLRVALADVNSHQPICGTVPAGADAGQDCDKHMRTVQAFAIDDTFKTVSLPLSTFIDKAVATVDRVADLDITKVYAIHFQLDPTLTAVDFYLDNLETY